MKVKIKQCRGFEGVRCSICKRQNIEAELLVKSLAYDGTCIYFVQDVKVINRPTKFNYDVVK